MSCHFFVIFFHTCEYDTRYESGTRYVSGIRYVMNQVCYLTDTWYNLPGTAVRAQKGLPVSFFFSKTDFLVCCGKGETMARWYIRVSIMKRIRQKIRLYGNL